MKLFRQLLVRMGLNAERLSDRQHLEQEGKLSAISFADLLRYQCLIVLNHIQ